MSFSQAPLYLRPSANVYVPWPLNWGKEEENKQGGEGRGERPRVSERVEEAARGRVVELRV